MRSEMIFSFSIRRSTISPEFFSLKFCQAHQGVHVSAAQTTERWLRAARSARSLSKRCALDHLLMSSVGRVRR
eukprot:16393943-Heterocapsa_arctica.AAC.1